jgi:hypothetical protein
LTSQASNCLSLNGNIHSSKEKHIKTMSNQKRRNRNYRGLAITAGVISAIAAAVGLTSNESVKAENPRVSVAVTNILSNTNAANFAAEIVAPPTDYLFTSASVGVNYGASPTNDPSQIVVDSGTITAIPSTYFSAAFTNTVENAIATAISNAVTANRYGDIIGIVNAYNPPDKSNTEYARISAAITNILSNTNSLNVAGEIVAPPSNFFSQATLEASYLNATSADAEGVFVDPSQALITSATFAATPATFSSNLGTNTVEGAIANAIDTAVSLTRFGDVIGITNVYKGPGTQPVKNARASMAITNILSNTNALNTAGEIVAPEGYQIDRIAMNNTYGNAAAVAGAFSDISQLLVISSSVEADVTVTPYVTDFSVEQSIALAIDSADDISRYGDVIGIVNAYKGPWGTGYANPRISLAATNILSNLNSQNFAGEIVAPKNDWHFSSATISIAYDNSPSADDQLLVESATITGITVATTPLLFSNTVESETANAINNAENDGRIGDVIGITKAWNPQSLD